MKVMKLKLCKVIPLKCKLCFRNNKIREFDTLERQTMGVNKYASTFPMASSIRKGVITEKKRENTQLFLQVRN